MTSPSSSSSSSSNSSYLSRGFLTSPPLSAIHDHSLFEIVDQANTIRELFNIIKISFHKQEQAPSSSERDSESTMLKRRIEEKSKQLSGGEWLLSFLNQLTPRHQSSPAISSSRYSTSGDNSPPIGIIPLSDDFTKGVNDDDLFTLINPQFGDLTDQELENLRSSPTMYGYLHYPLQNIFSLRDNILQKLHKLADPQYPFTPIVDNTSQPREIIDSFEYFLSKLLHYAIRANKPNLVDYLAQIQTSVNGITSDYLSTISEAMRLIHQSSQNDREFENAFSILTTLVQQRKSIKQTDLAKVLHFCSQHYRKPTREDDHIYNLSIFDQATSILIGFRLNSLWFFNQYREKFLKYVSHIYDMRGSHTEPTMALYDPANPAAPSSIHLEGMFPCEYIQFRLRLFLQILFENELNNNHEESLYEEFLSELETAWTILLIAYWKSLPLTDSTESNTNKFCKLLSQYTLGQIKNLKDKKEYTLQLGWTKHSICVAFIREDDKLRIRIDNLGEGYHTFHNFRKNPSCSGTYFVQPKLLAVLDFNDLPTTLENYLVSIIDNSANPKWDNDCSQGLNSKDDLISRVYTDKRFQSISGDDSSSTSSAPYYPSQIVGNCTFASFSVGVKQRVGVKLCTNIVEAEAGLLNRMNQLYRSHEHLFQAGLLPPQRLYFDQYEEFSIFLTRTLERHYAKVLSDCKSPYIMVPTIQNSDKDSTNSATLKEFFSNYSPSSFQIKLNGSAGVGKTVFSQNLYQHLVSKLGVKTFSFIFNIRLRNLSKKNIYPSGRTYSLLDIIERELFFPALKRKLYPSERILLQSIIDNKNILWVLDGLDELQHDLPHLKDAIQQMTQKRERNYVMMTSRPSIPLHPYIINEQIEFTIEEYAETEITLFIEKYFANQPNQLVSVENIKQALQSNQQLKDLCKVPIILSKVCESVKEGNEEILTTKNSAELYNHLVFTSCRTAFKRQFLGIIEEGSGGSIDDSLNHQSMVHFFRTALRFTQVLAFTSLEVQRQVTCTKEMMSESFHRFGMGQECDQRLVIKNLLDIGLFKPDENGGEFIHAIFQEFFAALYLLKLLNKPLDIENAQSFIARHKEDFNYHNVFAGVVHQLCGKIRKTEKEKKKAHLQGMLNQFLSHFVEPPTDVCIQQIIPLIKIYRQYPETYPVSLNGYPNSCISMLNDIFQHILHEKLARDPETLWEGSSKEALNAFFTFLVENSPLRTEINFNKRLISMMTSESDNESSSSSSSSSSSPTSFSMQQQNITINALKWIELSQSLDHSTLIAFDRIAQSHDMNYPAVREMTAFVLRYTTIVISKEQPTEQEIEELKTIKPLLDRLFGQLRRSWQINFQKGKRERIPPRPNHSAIAHQISSLLPKLYTAQSKDSSIQAIYDQCRMTLINLTKQMLDHPSGDWAGYWNGLIPLDSAILSWKEVLTDESTHKLKDYISSIYNDFYGQESSTPELTLGKEGPIDLDLFLMNTLNLFDLFNSEYSDMILEKLLILSTNGATNRNPKRSAASKSRYKAFALSALGEYRPNLAINPENQLARLENIYHRIALNKQKEVLNYLKGLREKLSRTASYPPETITLLNNTIRQLTSREQVMISIGIAFQRSSAAGLIEKKYSPTSTSSSSSSSCSSSKTTKRQKSI